MKIRYKIILSLLLLYGCSIKKHVNKNALIHQQTCIKQLENNDVNSAKINCELCLEYDKTQAECLNALGLIALLQKDKQKAIKFFHYAIRENNNFAQARNNLGVIYFEEGDFLKAKKHFTNALKIDPGNLDARYNKSLSLIRLYQKEKLSNKNKAINNLQKAKKEITKLIAIYPSYDFAFRELGLTNFYLSLESDFENEKENLLNLSKSAFEECLQYQNNADVCYEGLGQVHMHLGNFFLAWENFFLCLGHNNQNSVCKYQIIDTYENFVKSSNIYKEFSNKIKNNQEYALAHEAFCYLLFEKGLNQEAYKHCEIALRINPDLCNIKYKIATYWSEQKNIVNSQKYCKSFLLCAQDNLQKEKCHEIITANNSK